jgi:hypothetical protein
VTRHFDLAGLPSGLDPWEAGGRNFEKFPVHGNSNTKQKIERLKKVFGNRAGWMRCEPLKETNVRFRSASMEKMPELVGNIP